MLALSRLVAAKYSRGLKNASIQGRPKSRKVKMSMTMTASPTTSPRKTDADAPTANAVAESNLPAYCEAALNGQPYRTTNAGTVSVALDITASTETDAIAVGSAASNVLATALVDDLIVPICQQRRRLVASELRGFGAGETTLASRTCQEAAAADCFPVEAKLLFFLPEEGQASHDTVAVFVAESIPAFFADLGSNVGVVFISATPVLIDSSVSAVGVEEPGPTGRKALSIVGAVAAALAAVVLMAATVLFLRRRRSGSGHKIADLSTTQDWEFSGTGSGAMGDVYLHEEDSQDGSRTLASLELFEANSVEVSEDGRVFQTSPSTIRIVGSKKERTTTSECFTYQVPDTVHL